MVGRTESGDEGRMPRLAKLVRRLLVVLLLGSAIAQLAHRSPPVKKDSFLFDFSNVYSASRAWLAGTNPYRIQSVYAAWRSSAHGPHLGSPDPHAMRNWAAVYPPSSLVMLAPFAMLPAIPAHILWTAFNIAMLVVLVASVAELGKLRSWDDRLLLFACVLGSAAGLNALESGQPAMGACAGVALAAVAVCRGRPTTAGLLLGLAAALKFQVVLPFIVFYLFLRHWRVVLTAALTFALPMVIGIGRIESRGYHWYADWRQNVSATLEPGAVNDPRPDGAFRNDMVNLQTLVSGISRSDAVATDLVLLVWIPLVLLYVQALLRCPEPESDPLALGTAAALALLPVYHRLYDATALVLLMAWALSPGMRRSRWGKVGLVLLMAELLLPIDLIPFVLRRTSVFDGVVHTSWWQGLVVPHHAWAILAITTWSVFTFRREQLAGRVATVPLPRPPIPPRESFTNDSVAAKPLAA